MIRPNKSITQKLQAAGGNKKSRNAKDEEAERNAETDKREGGESRKEVEKKGRNPRKKELRQKASALSASAEHSREPSHPSLAACTEEFFLAVGSKDVAVERVAGTSTNVDATILASADGTDTSVSADADSKSKLVEREAASSGKEEEETVTASDLPKTPLVKTSELSSDKEKSVDEGSVCSPGKSNLEASTDVDASQLEASGYNTSAFNTSILDSTLSSDEASSGDAVDSDSKSIPCVSTDAKITEELERLHVDSEVGVQIIYLFQF